MMPSILLLDCSNALSENLKHQGFDVSSGTIGFCNAIRSLPSQVYEKDIIIYNPGYFERRTGGYIQAPDIINRTPEYSLGHLQSHIQRGATFLVFVNHIADDLEKQNEAYEWIPFMPIIHFTKDHKPRRVSVEGDARYKYLAPISLLGELKIPVLQKIDSAKVIFERFVSGFMRLFLNRNDEDLGILIEIMGNGKLLILPEYNSNEEIIYNFLHRIVPTIYNLQTRIGLIDKFSPPEESKARNKIQEIEDMQKKFTEALGEGKEQLADAQRSKVNTIKNDDTASLILNYYDLATQQESVALFYLYKIIDALENKFGGEGAAKNKLNCYSEWNLIGKLANESYGDMRHAPKPGEKIKEWNHEEIEECFEAGEKIILTYFGTLF